jgi:hypothetical protein
VCLFESVVAVAFHNIFYFLKIIFDISASKWSKNTKKILIWSKKNKKISKFFKIAFETQKQIGEWKRYSSRSTLKFIYQIRVYEYTHTHTHTFMHSYLTRIGQSSGWTDSSKIKDRQEQKNSQTQSAGSTHDQGNSAKPGDTCFSNVNFLFLFLFLIFSI